MSDDKAAVEHLLQASTPDEAHVLRHYLYLPTEEAAADSAADLRSRGFATEERLGADGTNWLVLATHAVVPSLAAIETTRTLMERLAARRGGEYDGWEAEVRQGNGVS